jgi:UDP-N-acetylglucosamine/UDP-N-acetylgalactosamine 4-epimerase
MTRYDEVREFLAGRQHRWLVTGAAGFIGSHLAEALLHLDQIVVGVDDFSTGRRENLTDVVARVGGARAERFRFVEGDICDPLVCQWATEGIDFVLHEAALGSVPRSMQDPFATHLANVDGFIRVLLAANAAGVRRIVYASSSSVYGDDPSDPKVEEILGEPLSPYAASKRTDELYAGTFAKTHGIDSVGLRYFNVFGPRQDPSGAYAAVIPRWIGELLSGQPCVVFGDGSASRDFCFVDNVVQANLLAACAPAAHVAPRVFNIACGERATLMELFSAIRARVATYLPSASDKTLQLEAPRPGDILHSRAAIDRARGYLGYLPRYDLTSGLDETVGWYADRLVRRAVARVGTADASHSTRAS